jgi:hypothetical protein
MEAQEEESNCCGYGDRGSEVQKECLDAGMDGFCPSQWGWEGWRAFWGYGLAWARTKAVGMCIGFNKGERTMDCIWSLDSIWWVFI